MTDLRALAEQLDQLREDLDYLTTLVEPEVADHGQSHAAGLAAAMSRSTSAHVWHTLTRTEASAAWTSLQMWVGWLTDRYQLEDTLPTCWYRHGAIVDELDALRAAWAGAYLDPAARATDAAYWHELLARALAAS